MVLFSEVRILVLISSVYTINKAVLIGGLDLRIDIYIFLNSLMAASVNSEVGMKLKFSHPIAAAGTGGNSKYDQ